MTDQQDEMREFTRGLFNRAADNEKPFAGERIHGQQDTFKPTPPEPVAGPVIPGQEKSATFNQKPTAEQRAVNRLFNAGTVREYL